MLLGISFEFRLARVAKKGKRSEWLLGKKIRGKLVKASKLPTHTDLTEKNTAGPKVVFQGSVLTSSQVLHLNEIFFLCVL